MRPTAARWVKHVAFAVAVAWTLVNVAGLAMALPEVNDSSPLHILTHVVLALGFGVAAFLLRPRRRRPAIHQSDARRDVLETEITDLQRQLNETQRSLDFTEQLLSQRPLKRNDQT